MDWAFFWIIWAVFGIVGGILGSSVNKSKLGFLLGVCLGPIGWVIVLLLPRRTEVQAEATSAGGALNQADTSTAPKRNLDNDAYKVWLGKYYDIKKNHLFEKYELGGSLFETLDDALSYADKLEGEREQESEKIKDAKTNELPESDMAAGYNLILVMLIVLFIILYFVL